MQISPLAGQMANPATLINVPQLITAYYTEKPDPVEAGQRVAFGTSGHRGSSLSTTFNENHILAITQAICWYRAEQRIEGPLFLGMDTHALSEPAHATAIEVLAANGVTVLIAANNDFTPTPAVSHAILTHNRGRCEGLADGILITPSHNPPGDGGFKYNPPNGGPADTKTTQWIAATANKLLENGLADVKRMSLKKALQADSTHEYDYIAAYVNDLNTILDLDVVRDANISIGVDPLGGAGVRYWQRIADTFRLNLEVVNTDIDPSFRFMMVDWDGKIRMDPSSPYVMRRLIELKDRFAIACACDADHDRHGIVTRSAGLLPPNHYLAVAVFYLFQHRPQWKKETAVGKTVVSSQIIERVAGKLGRKVLDVPVGFKWFVDGLYDGSLGFGGEESAGASFLRKDGSVWTTDKDGIILCLLAAEIAARMDQDPGDVYRELTVEFGEPVYERMEAAATAEQKKKFSHLTPDAVNYKEMAGETIQAVLTHAPGNGAPIGGLKVVTENGWFAARPSGTEDIYKIYAESFLGMNHLRRIQEEAQSIVNSALT